MKKHSFLFLVTSVLFATQSSGYAFDPGTDLLKQRLGDCYFAPTPSTEKIIVNHHQLSPNETSNAAWMRRCVVPMIPRNYGAPARIVAEVSWWSLRENVLLMNPATAVRYSNCHEPKIIHWTDNNGLKHARYEFDVNGKRIEKDRTRTDYPLYDCPTNIWQVGLTAGQVANYKDPQVEKVVDDIFRSIDPRISDEAVIAWTATLAGYGNDPAMMQAIINSKGRVRRSWLIRNPVVGAILTGHLEVVRECLIDKKSFCFKGDYTNAVRFGHSVGNVLKSISDLYRYYSATGSL